MDRFCVSNAFHQAFIESFNKAFNKILSKINGVRRWVNKCCCCSHSPGFLVGEDKSDHWRSGNRPSPVMKDLSMVALALEVLGV